MMVRNLVRIQIDQAAIKDLGKKLALKITTVKFQSVIYVVQSIIRQKMS